MKIRKYTSPDKKEIINLLRLNTPQYFAPDEENDLIYYLDNFSDNYYVVEIKKKIVACGGFNLTEDGKTGKISWDIVHPNSQGAGIGTELTKYRIKELKNIEGIEIISVRTSQLVYKFYEKFGLQLREIIKDYWAEGFDMYRLDCKINSTINL